MQKMDRLERLNRARMNFTKVINENNWQKRRMITSFTENDFKKVSKAGIEEANGVFTDLAREYVNKNSLGRRLRVIHGYCTTLELQEGHGMIKEQDLPKIPLVSSEEIVPLDYDGLMKNKPPQGLEMSKSSLSCVSLLQPYQLPPSFEK